MAVQLNQVSLLRARGCFPPGPMLYLLRSLAPILKGAPNRSLPTTTTPAPQTCICALCVALLIHLFTFLFSLTIPFATDRDPGWHPAFPVSTAAQAFLKEAPFKSRLSGRLAQP